MDKLLQFHSSNGYAGNFDHHKLPPLGHHVYTPLDLASIPFLPYPLFLRDACSPPTDTLTIRASIFARMFPVREGVTKKGGE